MQYPDVQKMIDILKNIETNQCGFNMLHPVPMRDWKQGYKTTCCIGGHAVLAIKHETGVEEYDIVPALSDLCNIPSHVALAICYPKTNKTYAEITVDEAIVVLERCRDTGEVDFTIGDRGTHSSIPKS